MKSYYAYIRVSTTRQGEEGVSLQEQKRAILEYASRRGITITEWFEEQVSAAKRGRPVFTRLVSMLKSKKNVGLIIHKIDRGSRNLRDWADLGELMDRGIEVHFAHESIDLLTRSGRLSADILAVVASDYIRNLREETLKGINGRLRQGLFPFSAPIGYANHGGGKAKTIDPMRGALIRQAFELYASREYSLRKLENELFSRGLRTRTGKKVDAGHLALILRNPFYMGLMRIRGRKETFPGVHVPLIPASLYNDVQLVLSGKRTYLKQQNRFRFRLLIRCEHCKLYLYAERQKGHVYYRCHRRFCPITCIREERFEDVVLDALKKINISPEEEQILKQVLQEFSRNRHEIAGTLRRELENELARVQEFIKTILQKFLDTSISKETFDEGHTTLLMQRSTCAERLARLSTEYDVYQEAQDLINSLRSVCERYCTGSPEQIRGIVEEMFQTITTSGSTIHFDLTPFMHQLAAREKTIEGWQRLFPIIVKETSSR